MVEIKDFLRQIFLHDQFHRYAAYLNLVLALWVLRDFFRSNRADVIAGIRGDDGKFNSLEIVFVVWIVLYSTVIFTTLFFALPFPAEGWWTLEILIFFILGGKKAPEIIMAVKGRGIQEVQVTETKSEGDTITETKVKKQEAIDPATSPTSTQPLSSSAEKKGGGGVSSTTENLDQL
jgi:hypothetical protein